MTIFIMLKNEDTYCTVQHKIVRELGAWEAIVYGTIAGLLRKSDGIGEVSNQTMMDMLGKDKKSIYRWIDSLIKSGYIEKRSGDGRGNISIYYISKKGGNLTPFNNEKGGQNDPKRVAKNTKKGGNLTPFLKEETRKDDNKGKIKDKNNLSSSFEVQQAEPSKNAEREEEEKILIEEKNNISTLEEVTPEMENAAVESVKSLFASSEEKITPSVKESFKEFWDLFTPDEDQKCKYKVALYEWNDMEENYRAAAIKYLATGHKPNNNNPYFWLQHFHPLFMNDREAYAAYKQHVQLCRVRWKGKQLVCSSWMADLFQLEILDAHYEQKFDM